MYDHFFDVKIQQLEYYVIISIEKYNRFIIFYKKNKEIAILEA